MNRTRLPIVLTLIVSLLAAGLTRQWAAYSRATGVGAAHVSGSARLSSMNSFALALLLGGLRGPLVMFLWPSAEAQKQDKNLEDFDTKIEWIRLLQAEFDTVHIFQIWNKAYNISVQMANLGNKYRTILDALDYAQSVDAERPNDINILSAIGQVYFDKLANSAEKVYYRQRVRDETMARQPMARLTFPSVESAAISKLAIDAGVPARKVQLISDEQGGKVSLSLPQSLVEKFRGQLASDVSVSERPMMSRDHNDPGWRRMELDPLLTETGTILPEYLSVKTARPDGLDSTAEWNDGSELQYLKQYEPFPYGVSPWGIAYNYYKRCEVLLNVNKQKHAQLSDLVVDSRPALSLKNWSEEEWEQGRIAEAEAFDRLAPAERNDLEVVTADIAAGAAVNRPRALKQAIFQYAMSARLCADAIAEYRRHLVNDQTNITIYLSHIDDLNSEHELTMADCAYLRSFDAPPDQRAALLSSAKQYYTEAQRRYDISFIQYCLTEEITQKVLPPGVTRANLPQGKLAVGTLNSIVTAAHALLPQNLVTYEHGDDVLQYGSYLRRCQERLALLSR